MNEDVQINLFRYSLEGIAHDWCRSLPIASINSLTIFHVAFNLFCKEYFFAEHLYEKCYEKCCDEFYLLCKYFACHERHNYDEEFSIEESTFHDDQEVLMIFIMIWLHKKMD